MSKCAVCNEEVMSTDKGVTVEDWCVWHTYHDEDEASE